MSKRYWIFCREHAPLSTWTERSYTRREIIEKFYSYALHEWDRVNKKVFTLGFISEMWNVDFEEDKDNA